MPEVSIQTHEMSPAQKEAEFSRIENAKADLVDETIPPTEQGGEIETPQQGQPEPTQQEGKILNRFSSQEELENAYKSLQAEYTRLKQGLPPKVGEPDQGQEPDQSQQNGQPQITQEQFDQVQSSLFETAGGADKYKAIQTWASNQLDEGRKQAFNDALAQGKTEQAVSAFKAIMYDYIQQNGWEPPPIRGRETSQRISGFQSQGQVTAAMADPRYDHGSPMFDKAYHDEVVARLRASSVLDVA